MGLRKDTLFHVKAGLAGMNCVRVVGGMVPGLWSMITDNDGDLDVDKASKANPAGLMNWSVKRIWVLLRVCRFDPTLHNRTPGNIEILFCARQY